MRMPKETNVCSRVLTNDEHNRLFRLLGDHCVTLATGVVQFYLAEPSDRPQWTKKYTGVVGFIKDYGKHSFYIRIYDIQRNLLVWQQEIYNELETFTLFGSFIFFEAHDCIAGMCFANDDDALNFKNAVQAKLDKRNSQATRHESSQVPVNTQISRPMTSPQKKVNLAADLHLQTTEVRNGGAPELSNRLTLDDIDALRVSGSGKKNKKESSKKDKKKKNGAKLEISAPIAGTFKVETHVGADLGIDFNDPAILELLSRAGLQHGRLRDAEKDLIADFIKQKGGMAAVQQQYGPLAQLQMQQQHQAPRRPSQPQIVPMQNGQANNIPPPPPLAQPELPQIQSMKTASQIQSSRQQLQQMQAQIGNVSNGSATMRAPSSNNYVQQTNPQNNMNNHQRMMMMQNIQQQPRLQAPPVPPPAPELPPREASASVARPQLPPRPSNQPPQRPPMNGTLVPSGPPPPPPAPPLLTPFTQNQRNGGSVPPPPPPLPPSNGPPAPPLPPPQQQMAKTAPVPTAEPGRNQLLDAIRKHGGAATLRPIRSTSSDENNGMPFETSRRESAAFSGDPRDTIMAQIKDGLATTRLKKVGPPDPSRHQSEHIEDANDLAAQLRKALESRQGVLQPSSDEDDSGDDEDEWAS